MTVHPHCPTLFDALELLDYLARTGGTAFANTLDARLPGLTVFVPTRLTYPGPADTYVATLLAADPALRPRLASGTPACVSLMGDYFPNLAAAVGLHFGISPAKVAAALTGYEPQNNCSQVLRTVAGNDVVLDAYNANPNSMAAALRSFAHRPCAPGQTKLMVLGDMLELGAASRFEHRVVGELLAGLPLPQVLLIGPEMAAGGSISPGVARGHHSRSRRLATPTPRAGPAGAGEGQPRPGAGNAAGDAVAQLSAGAGPAMPAG